MPVSIRRVAIDGGWLDEAFFWVEPAGDPGFVVLAVACGRFGPGRAGAGQTRHRGAGARRAARDHRHARPRSSRGRAAGMRFQPYDEVHAQQWRHRLDADLDGAGIDDDGAGPGSVLWRHGAQEERRRHRYDQLRDHLPGHGALRRHQLQHGLSCGLALHWRPRPDVLSGDVERHLDQYRQSQFPGADDSRSRSTPASR